MAQGRSNEERVLHIELSAMIDSQTRKIIRVSAEGSAGPYVMIPVDQLPAVRQILDQRQIQYWVDSCAISLNGKPAVAFVNFGRGGDAPKIQAILDELS